MKRVFLPFIALIFLSFSTALAASPYSLYTEDPTQESDGLGSPYGGSRQQGFSAGGQGSYGGSGFGAPSEGDQGSGLGSGLGGYSTYQGQGAGQPGTGQGFDPYQQYPAEGQYPGMQDGQDFQDLQGLQGQQYQPYQQYPGQSGQQNQQYQQFQQGQPYPGQFSGQQLSDQQMQQMQQGQQMQPGQQMQGQQLQQGQQFPGQPGQRTYYQQQQLPQDQEDYLPLPPMDEDYLPRVQYPLLKKEGTPLPDTQQQQLKQQTDQSLTERRDLTPEQQRILRARKRMMPRKLSVIERTLSENPVTADKVKPLPYGTGVLTQFGYSFFRPELSGFAPQSDIPVGGDYLVNVGDRLSINVWGSLDATYNLEVNRAGEIVFPKIGAVKVAGQRFDQLPTLITAHISRFYKNFHLNVNMGRLRSIKIYVVGEVTAPGDYNVHALSTVLSALAIAGGPTKNGSLRNIQITRGGKVVEAIDLYEFFLKGDKGRDIRLLPGDTVLVPVIGPVAGVAGNVRRPGIYELKGENNLKDLLVLAGGINPSGYLQRVQVYRVDAHDKKEVTDVNLDMNGDRTIDQVAGGIPVKDHDVVKVLPIDSVLRGYVRLTGHVLRPGDVALKPGMRVSALLAQDNLLPEYYPFAGQIIRLVPPDQHPEVIFFDLSKAMKGDPVDDLELKEFDRVKVFARKEMQEIPFVRVNGEVQRPGQKRYFENMTVRDLLMAGGNVKLNAYLKNAEITRLKKESDKVSSFSIQVDLEKALAGGPENIKLQPFDELSVRRIPNWTESTERYVLLKGEFAFPGVYPIYKGERLSSVIERAGGFTDLAYLKGVKFTRENARRLQQQRMDEALVKAQEDIIKLQTKMAQTAASPEEAASAKTTLDGLMQSVEVLKAKKAEGRILIEIESLKELKGSVYDVELQAGDRLTVPSDPGSVNVIGDVYNQNSIVSQAGKDVRWYLDQVGGPTGDADLGEVYVVKVNGSVISRKNSGHFLFFNSFWNKQLDSGDTVIVPRKYEKTAWLRDIKDIAQVLGNIAVTAGVLLAAGLKF